MLTYEIFVNNNQKVFPQYQHQMKSLIASQYSYLKSKPEQLNDFFGQVNLKIAGEFNKKNHVFIELFESPEDPDGSKQTRFQGYLIAIFRTVYNEMNPERKKLYNFLKGMIKILENKQDLSSYKIRIEKRKEIFILPKDEDFYLKYKFYCDTKEDLNIQLKQTIFNVGNNKSWADNLYQNLYEFIGKFGIIRMNDVYDILLQYFEKRWISLDDEYERKQIISGQNDDDESWSVTPEKYFKQVFLQIDNTFSKMNRPRAIYIFYAYMFRKNYKVEDICNELHILKGSYSNVKTKLLNLLDTLNNNGFNLPKIQFEEKESEFLQIFAKILKNYNPDYYKFVFERKGDTI
jgi:hypothetical protein